MHKPREPRHKILRIGARDLVAIFNWMCKPSGCLTLPECDGLPRDAEVISIQSNWQYNCLEVLVYHQTFDVVPECAIPPYLPPPDGSVRVVTPEELGFKLPEASE